MKKIRVFLIAFLILTLLPVQSNVFAEGEALQIGDQVYSTLAEAVTAASSTEETTIEIIGDLEVTSSVTITKDIKLVNSGDAHTISFGSSAAMFVQGGGSLTLGDGDSDNTFTITSQITPVQVSSGELIFNDGIIINSSSYGVALVGADSHGSISGGQVTAARNAIYLQDGPNVDVISGGTFSSGSPPVYLTGLGTRIDEITGGYFYQTSTTETGNSQGAFIQNGSTVGEISGGYFESVKSAAICIIRGASVETISGGEFVGAAAANGALEVIGDDSSGSTGTTSVGAISGGYFHGANRGVLVYSYTGISNAQVGSVTGGTFEGSVGYQNDVGTVTIEILGGTFNATNRGILNAGTIGNIGGLANITGQNQGIYNYQNATIGEISGGNISGGSTNSTGILNLGTIDLISGGTIFGGQNSINNISGSSNGTIDTISGGVFWGENGDAIVLANTLRLEPDLTSSKGVARFWGNEGIIFNNDELVEFPYNSEVESYYYMSIETESVEGLENVGFKYLRLPFWDLLYDANIPEGADGSQVSLPSNQTDISLEDDSITPGSPEGVPVTTAGIYTFDGWNTKADGTGDSYSAEDVILVEATQSSLTLYAQWVFTPAETFTVTYNGNGNTGGTVPTDENSPYLSGSTVTVLGQGDMTNGDLTFMGWATSAEGTADYTSGQTFTIDSNITLYAVWEDTSGGTTGGGIEEETTGSAIEEETTGSAIDDETTGSAIDDETSGSGADGGASGASAVEGESISSIPDPIQDSTYTQNQISYKTGDDSNMIGLLILLLSSAFVVVGILVYRRKLLFNNKP